MGHLINPISLRLSTNSFWSSSWALINNFNYVNIYKKDYILFHFLNWFIKKSKFIKFNLLISHYKVYRVNKKIYINLYYYNGGDLDYSTETAIFDIMLNNDFVDNTEQFESSLQPLYEYVYKVVLFNLYWRVINSSLTYYFNKFDNTKELFFFNVYNLDFFNISVDSIASFISLKLQRRYSLNWILQPILKDLATKMKQKNFLGYKIVCSGRFTRKQIATYMWTRNGTLKLGGISNLIKYSQTRVRLKYGLCGIKVWINYGCNNYNLIKRNMSLIYPLFVPFKYLIDKNKKVITFFFNNWFFFFIRVVFLKLKSFLFYEEYMNIKIKIILNNILEDIIPNFLASNYAITLLNSNIFYITPIITKINYLDGINFYIDDKIIDDRDNENETNKQDIKEEIKE